MASKRGSMLGKLAMPKKPMGEMEADQDLMMEDMGMGEEKMPMEPEMEEEGDAGVEPEEDMFADFSDEDILAEAKKRGLSLESEESPEDEEEDLLEMEDEEEMV